LVPVDLRPAHRNRRHRPSPSPLARIRREHLIKGKTIKKIARDLNVSRNTVRKVPSI
jgi:DNA-binding NarL/FixJ family response regulator